MTNELKAKFFAQYIGQNVVGHETDNCNFRLTEISLTDCEVGLFGDWSGGTHPQQSCNDLIGIDTVWLNLRSLASITDEDAIEISKAENWNYENDPAETNIQSVKNMIINSIEYNRGATNLFTYQYLLSESYALPFMGISAEQLVKSGWVKLITDK